MCNVIIGSHQYCFILTGWWWCLCLMVFVFCFEIIFKSNINIYIIHFIVCTFKPLTQKHIHTHILLFLPDVSFCWVPLLLLYARTQSMHSLFFVVRIALLCVSCHCFESAVVSRCVCESLHLVLANWGIFPWIFRGKNANAEQMSVERFSGAKRIHNDWPCTEYEINYEEMQFDFIIWQITIYIVQYRTLCGIDLDFILFLWGSANTNQHFKSWKVITIVNRQYIAQHTHKRAREYTHNMQYKVGTQTIRSLNVMQRITSFFHVSHNSKHLF